MAIEKVNLTDTYGDQTSESRKVITPSQRTDTTSYAMPDATTNNWLDGQLAPVASSMGLNPDGSMRSMRDAIGYSPEYERAKRDAQRRLEQWKKKEAGYQAAFSLLGDSISASIGGNVWPNQTPNKAAEANQRDLALQQEQKAEDLETRGRLQNIISSYANFAKDYKKDFLTKVQKTQKTGGEEVTTTTKPGYTNTRQRAFNVKEDGEGSDKSKGKGKGEKGYYMNFIPNENGSQGNPYAIDLKDEETYSLVHNVIQRDLRRLIADMDSEDDNVANKARNNYNALVKDGVIKEKSNGAYEFDVERIMEGGVYRGLSDQAKSFVNMLAGKTVFGAIGADEYDDD